MTLAIVHSRAVSGMRAYPVTIEVHISPGLPGLGMVGLPETTVKESRHRVRSAIINAGFDYPSKRMTVNLAPADQPKEGANFDLAIAVGILVASGQIQKNAVADIEFYGELALSGQLKPVRAMLPLALGAMKDHHAVMIPKSSVSEASLVDQLDIYAAEHLAEVIYNLNGFEPLTPVKVSDRKQLPVTYPCFSNIAGQQYAKRALEVAAAGGHHVLMSGPPGSGKTLLASTMPGLLPEMTLPQALAAATIQSLSSQGFDLTQWRRRPFRSPHHTTSQIAMIGGGTVPRPGEVSLAHQGILFLDEFPEFQRHVLEVLREPLESREVHVSRAAATACFPAAFQLIAAMNPCPCGYYGDVDHECRCTPDKVLRYQGRLSGPLLDRIDIQLQVERIPTKQLLLGQEQTAETSEQVRERVTAAYQMQHKRAGKANTFLSNSELRQYCVLGVESRQVLEQAIERFHLSMRAVHRVLKVSRTIADLEAASAISCDHLAEALGYRKVEVVFN